MVIDEEIYLEHFGRKGMKWGARRAKNKTHTRSQKTVSAVASVGAGFIAARIVSTRTMDTKMGIVTGAAVGAATKRVIDNSFDKNKDVKISSLFK